MPYVNAEARKRLDPDIENLNSHIHSLGELNYAITRLAVMAIARAPARTYASLSAIHGVLHDAASEFYRRVIGPYEDGKMKEHGDVY